MSDSDQNLKKSSSGFANLHYPGMRIGPQSHPHTLDEKLLKAFQLQVTCIGEEAQARLQATSVFFPRLDWIALELIPLFVQSGIGRIGIFGERPVTEIDRSLFPSFFSTESVNLMEAMKKWAHAQPFNPQFQLECFSFFSIDRCFSDMSRGFDWIIWTQCNLDSEQSFISYAPALKEHDTWLFCLLSGRKEYCSFQEPAAEWLRAEEIPQGLYWPSLKKISGEAARKLCDAIIEGKKN